MQIPEKYLKIAKISLISLLAIILIAGGIAYAKREALLNAAIKRVISKADRDYNLELKIESATFVGLSSVQFKNITAVPQDRDSLAKIENFKIGVKLFPLLFGDIKLAEINLDKGIINLVKKDSISNYDFLFRKSKTDSTSAKSDLDLAKFANNLINEMLYKIPDDMDIRDFRIKLQDDSNLVDINTTNAKIDGGEVNSTIKINGNESTWHIEGNVDPDDKQLDLMLFAENKKVELPYLEKKFGLKLNFDTARTEMRGLKKSGDELKISGLFEVKNMLVKHPRISASDVIVERASMDAEMLIGENFISIDSASTIHIKDIDIHPFIKYTVSPAKIYEFKIRTDEMDAQQIFNSFPQGLFESLEGMQVAGKLQYSLDFYLDSEKPDDVIFNSRLKNNGFKVKKWGKTNLQKINGNFIYTPYEYGKPMRDIIIGPENPNFTPIDQISPNLKNALLTAEDPSFYSHNGFVEESIRKSIATNFKEKAFKRGGSTISMQLVKNVFLNRQKTLSRKIEEILIVWIMENGRLSSKQRMFETYLNLIEWGRNVYGIGEAASYYFSKHPSELNIGESIFLASIVPKPKSGLYRFEGDGSLRSGLASYFNFIGGIMAKRGMTAPDSTNYGFYSVRLRESLRSGLPTDSLVVDSLLKNSDLEEDDLVLQQLSIIRKIDSLQLKQNSKAQIIQKDTSSNTILPSRKEKREQRKIERKPPDRKQ
ncbi:transglycosylase domain-containing protein [Daejeonella sp.]|jgi:hypothetical protein|uniref:transglycosylase domain-containing protein n=1 Tax=Daejeonella sp. TaxID=2805397 RepID=UPI0037C0E253